MVTQLCSRLTLREEGYCYSAFVKINGKTVEALNMANCRFDPSDPGTKLSDVTIYGLEGIPVTRTLPTLRSKSESPKDIQAVAGKCTETSYTNQGPVDEDISGSRVAFNCNGAGLFFMDDQLKRVIIRFLNSDHPLDHPMLGFSGLMQDDGQTLDVTEMYYLDPNGAPIAVASDSKCILDFEKPNLTGIHCVAHFTDGDRKYLGVVNFRAAANQ